MKSTILSAMTTGWAARALRVVAFGAVAVAAAVPAATTAEAHGERSQQAFLRMRTMNWYDVKWSKTELSINDEMELTGKVHVFSGWPQAVANPGEAFLNVGEPGPVLIRKGAFVGGVPVPRTFSMEVGKDYEYKILLKARRQGRYHVHVQINVKDGGPIVGPGQWITIKGDMKDFTNPVTLLDGGTIDLESYGINWTYTYHFAWMAIGAVWVIYWFLTKGIIVRYWWVKAGKADELIGPSEKRIGGVALAAMLLAVLVTYGATNKEFPRTLPMQAGLLTGIEPIDLPDPTVKLHFMGGQYTVPGRELTIKYHVTNNGNEPVKVGDWTAAGLRFLNPDVFTTKPEFPDYLLADRGLSTDATPIAPGETKEIQVKIQDARWDIERLSDLAYDTDSQVGGLFFFFTPSGRRFAAEIGGPVIPKFVAGDMP